VQAHSFSWEPILELQIVRQQPNGKTHHDTCSVI